MNDFRKIIDQLDIVNVVSENMELKRAGNNFKGLCPFHSESTPSFIVSPNKGIFKCFGCGESGDALSFYMKIKKLNFIDAIKELGKKYNIDVSFLEKNRKSKVNKSDYNLLNETAEYFKKSLFSDEGKHALEYFNKNRKFSENTIYDNYLGYSPSFGLIDHLKSKGFDIKDMVKLGLAKKKEDRFYDTFRNRAMFTIFDSSSQVVGFGGRGLNDSSIPKYLNSQESSVFKKGNLLYGIFDKRDIIDSKHAILVEGYTDVISFRNFGIKNSVASLGTALTRNQAELLKKLCNNVLIFYDSDSAGIKATERAIIILKAASFNVKVLTTKEFKDPDELLNNKGVEGYKELVKDATESFDFLYALYSDGMDIEDVISKRKIIDMFKPFFSVLDSLNRDIYESKLSTILMVSKNVLHKYFSSGVSIERKSYIQNSKYFNNLELQTLALLTLKKEFLDEIKKYSSIKRSKISFIMGLRNDNIVEEVINLLKVNGYDEKSIMETVSLDRVTTLSEEIMDEWSRLDIEGSLEDMESVMPTSDNKKEMIKNYYKKKLEMGNYKK